MKRAKSASEPVTLSPCQIVAWNVENLRRANHWSQEEAARRLRPYLGYTMSRAAWSQMERSLKGNKIRRFDADELVAFARVFDKPVAYFFCVPAPHYQGRPVVVNGKPGQPKASVKSKPLSEKEMTALSGQAWAPGFDANTIETFKHLWLFAGESILLAWRDRVEKDPKSIDAIKSRSGSAKLLEELIEQVRQTIFSPSQEAGLTDSLLEASTRRSGR
jgi:hypothetical protein